MSLVSPSPSPSPHPDFSLQSGRPGLLPAHSLPRQPRSSLSPQASVRLWALPLTPGPTRGLRWGSRLLCRAPPFWALHVPSAHPATRFSRAFPPPLPNVLAAPHSTALFPRKQCDCVTDNNALSSLEHGPGAHWDAAQKVLCAPQGCKLYLCHFGATDPESYPWDQLCNSQSGP